jgi:hypothetical protein
MKMDDIGAMHSMIKALTEENVALCNALQAANEKRDCVMSHNRALNARLRLAIPTTVSH